MGRNKVLHDNHKVTFRCSGKMFHEIERVAYLADKPRSELIRESIDKYLDDVMDLLGRRDA